MPGKVDLAAATDSCGCPLCCTTGSEAREYGGDDGQELRDARARDEHQELSLFMARFMPRLLAALEGNWNGIGAEQGGGRRSEESGCQAESLVHSSI